MAGSQHKATAAFGARLPGNSGPIFPDWSVADRLQNAYDKRLKSDGIENVAGRIARCSSFEAFDDQFRSTDDMYSWAKRAVFSFTNASGVGTITALFPNLGADGFADRYIAFYVNGCVGTQEIGEVAHEVWDALVEH